jgi:hypothetical protein
VKKICFIDDQADEIQLFKDAYSERFEVIAKTNFDECQKEIVLRKWKKPDLFVLDLYFPRGKPDEATLKLLRTAPVDFILDQASIEKAVYNCERANARLEAILQAYRQSPEGGLELSRLARKHYSKVPMVFYSRQPTSDDYLRAMREPKVLDLIPKLAWPQGKTEEERRMHAKTSCGPISDRFLQAMEPAKDSDLLKKSIEIVWKAIQYLPKP